MFTRLVVTIDVMDQILSKHSLKEAFALNKPSKLCHGDASILTLLPLS